MDAERVVETDSDESDNFDPIQGWVERTPPQRSSDSPLLDEAVAHLPSDQQTRLRSTLIRHDILAYTWEDLRPSEVNTIHHFTLTDYSPIHFRPRRLHPHYQDIVRREVDRMLEAGVIVPVESEWAFPLLIIGKPDGSVLFCVDFRKLNERMPRDNYPLQLIDEILDGLRGARIFSTIELFSGYWRVRLSPECSKFATFICKFGTFAFLVTPYDLRNAPATFQRMMFEVFKDFPFVALYMDDILVFRDTR